MVVKNVGEAFIDEKMKELQKEITEKGEILKEGQKAFNKIVENYSRLIFEKNKYFMQKSDKISVFIKVRKYDENKLYCTVSLKSDFGQSTGTADFLISDPQVRGWDIIAEEEYEKQDLLILENLELKRTAGLILPN